MNAMNEMNTATASNATTETAASYAALTRAELPTVRAAIRCGAYRGQTAGLARGFLQTNVVILPAQYARDFAHYCARNPKPCPLIAATDAGARNIDALGNIDICRDVPAYNVYRHGQLAFETTEIESLWRDDLTAFLLGCSFSFEDALMRAGIALWHIRHNSVVPMYRTNIATVAAGAFGGAMVVSMRMIADHQLTLAQQISRRHRNAHGAPVHIGAPREIGVDLSRPDWGDRAPTPPGHTAMFWACGVTPQLAIARAKIPFCITHKPGHMLITEMPADAEPPIATAAVDTVDAVAHIADNVD